MQKGKDVGDEKDYGCCFMTRSVTSCQGEGSRKSDAWMKK